MSVSTYMIPRLVSDPLEVDCKSHGFFAKSGYTYPTYPPQGAMILFITFPPNQWFSSHNFKLLCNCIALRWFICESVKAKHNLFDRDWSGMSWFDLFHHLSFPHNFFLALFFQESRVFQTGILTMTISSGWKRGPIPWKPQTATVAAWLIPFRKMIQISQNPKEIMQKSTQNHSIINQKKRQHHGTPKKWFVDQLHLF